MLLAVDIGNSTVSFGLYKEPSWKNTWKIETHSREPIYFQQKITETFVEESIAPETIDKVVISSVVPDLTDQFVSFFSKMDKARVILLNRKLYHLLPVRTDNPYELGTDLLANALAAFIRYQTTVLVIDFGTALTFTLVEKSGLIRGVNIVPGIITAIKSLSANTAQLQEVTLEKPASDLGTNTVEAIQNGILIGYEGLVRFMIEKIRSTRLDKVKVIATGGLAELLPSAYFDETDKNLTLDGLRLVGNFV